MAHILLVDDEPLVVRTLSNALATKDHTFVTASNGIDGLKRFAEGNFDLVITDIIMPDMEGMEMIMEIRQRAPNAKILAMSGGGRTVNREFMEMAEGLGAMATLKKPIRLAEFFDALKICLNERPRLVGQAR